MSLKKIVALILTNILIVASAFAQSTLTLNVGAISDLSFYDKYGQPITNVNPTNIAFDESLIIKTQKNKAIFSFGDSLLTLDKESLVVINYTDLPTCYLVDGSVNLVKKSSLVGEVKILTPVTEYSMTEAGEVSVTSTVKEESSIVYSGSVTSINLITNEQKVIASNEKAVLNNQTNIEMFNSKQDLLDKQREAYLNANYLYGIKPVLKSNTTEESFDLHLIVTGNGQGSINYLDYSALSGLLKKAKLNNQKILLVDGGNTISGSAYVNQDKGQNAVTVLEKTGYDVYVPGAMDFSFGIDQLKKLSNTSEINFISTNALQGNAFAFAPYGLYVYNNFKVAVLGLSNPSDITPFMDINLTSQKIIDNLQNGIDLANSVADYVIVVSNVNYKDFNATYIANNLKGIDLLIDSNSNKTDYTYKNNSYIIKTGVGNSEFFDVKLSVIDDNVVNVTPLRIFSSNLNNSEDNLLNRVLGVQKFDNDQAVADFIASITYDPSYSQFLISPKILSATTAIDTIKLSTVREKQSDVKVPSIVSSIKSTVETIPAVVPATPTFLPTKTRKAQVEPVVEPIKEDVAETEMENLSEVQPVITTTENDASYKSHVGISTNLSGGLTVDSASFNSISDKNLKLTFTPYYRNPSFKVGLNLDVSVDTFSPFKVKSNVIPENTDLWSLVKYGTSLISYLQFESKSGEISLDISRNNYQTNFISPVTYYTLGDGNLHFTAKYDNGRNSFYLFTNDISVDSYRSAGNPQQGGLVGSFTLENQLFTGRFGVLASENSLTNRQIDLYPIVNAELQFVNNSKFTSKLILSGALYLPVYPNFDFTKVVSTTGATLFPNYLASADLQFKFNDFDILFGAIYGVNDGSDLNIYRFNKTTPGSRTNMFDFTGSGLIAPRINFAYDSSFMNLNLIYTAPLDFTASGLSIVKNDLLDASLGVNINNINFGLFFMQNSFINSIMNMSSIGSYFLNNHTDLGAYIGYSIDSVFDAKLSLGVPSDLSKIFKASLSLTYHLDKAF